ncbi:MAG: hypothetical protein KAS32_30160 [Candidatus Peribacteraceae bacterium]|nr:hypothetical protein [Candidatus Peribacteraceae bacterium]
MSKTSMAIEIIDEFLERKRKHSEFIITPWSQTPHSYSIRISMNLFDRVKMTPFNTPKPEDHDVELSTFFICEELRKCKHKHSIAVPFKDNGWFNNDNGLVHTEVYTYSNNIRESVSLLLDFKSNNYIILKIISNVEEETVLFSEILIDDNPSSTMGVVGI